MLLEQMLENSIKTDLSALKLDAFIITSRENIVEPEDITSIIAIQSQIRTSDAFTLSPCSVPVTISIVTRVELDPDKSKHNDIVDKIMSRLSDLHFNAHTMETVYSNEKFLAGELSFNGGSGFSYDRSARIYEENISFTIRGTEIKV